MSVVIPCYNYGHYLRTAVRSVLEQRGVEVEVIVIDDASTDGSAAVARELAVDDRVRTIVHRTNRGHVFTGNEGIEHATGDYLVVLSADDALTPGALARAAALLDAQPSIGFVYGFPVTFSEDPPPTVSARLRSWTILSGEEWIARRCRSGSNCIISPEAVMRMSVQRAIGGQDANIPQSHDFDIWLRAAAVSDVGRINGPPQAFYRVHSKSMTHTVHAGLVIDLEGRLAAFEKVMSDPVSHISDRETLLAIARRSLAESALEAARAAYDRGRATVEPVEDYLAFAVRVWPGVRRTRKWRALERYSMADPRLLDRRLGSMVRRAAQDMQWRVRWRRWRWNGV